MVNLPTYVTFKGVNGKLLCIVENTWNLWDLLVFAGSVGQVGAVHEVVPTGDGRNVMIRCVGNGKFWRRRADVSQQPTSIWADYLGGANEYNLFRPYEVDASTNTVALRCVGNDEFCQSMENDLIDSISFLDASASTISSDAWLIFEKAVDSVAFNFPRYVTFKGDNGKLLRLHEQEGYPYLTYTGDDTQGSMVMHEVVQEKFRGSVMIKCMGNGKFWRLSPFWIWADHEELPSPSDGEANFVPVSLAPSTMQLRCVANDLYCVRLTRDGKTDALCAWVREDNVQAARIIVGEPVVSRRLENIVYNLDNSRVVQGQPSALQTSSLDNPSSYKADLKFALEKQVSRSATWSNSISVGASVKATFVCGVPMILDGEIEVGASLGYTRTWGETEVISETIKREITVKDVLPRGKVTGTLYVTEARCDVPFTYTQVDTLLNRTTVREKRSDGLFTGVNVSRAVAVTRDGL